MKGLHVVLAGNVVDGICVIGPFKTGDDATNWGITNLQGGDDPWEWHIATLDAPSEWEIE